MYENYARPDLIEWTNNQCVIVRGDPVKLGEMVCWCEESAGERRPYHPIGEAKEGWMDYFEGEWAYEVHEFHNGNNEYNFWFWKQSIRMQFALKFQ